MLAEIARAAPPGRVGEMTGGALFFGFGGSMFIPAIFGILLDLTDGDYLVCFGMIAAIALVAGLLFLLAARGPRPGSAAPMSPAQTVR